MDNKLYTTKQIEEFADGDEQFLKDTILIFVKEAPENVSKLEEGLQQGSWNKLREIAHRFAPHLAFFEINDAYFAVRKIEALAQEQTGLAEIAENLEIVKDKGMKAINQMIADFGF